VYEAFTFLLSTELNDFSIAGLTGGARSALSFSTLQRSRVGLQWPLWVMMIWIGGVFVSLLSIVSGRVGLSVLIKRARPIENKTFHGMIEQISEQMGIKRKVELLVNSKCKLPSTCKVFKPVILFPSEAVSWPKERVLVVLLHELSHVKREDYLTNMVSRVICSVYWFMPLIWLAHYFLSLEQEKASDASVIRMGVEPVEYAEHIVDFARFQRKPILLAGIFILRGRKKILEKRVINAVNQRNANVHYRKSSNKIKPLKLILISGFILAFLVLLASIATGSNYYKKAFEAEVAGTWVNPDYNGKEEPIEGGPHAKIIVESDKTLETYNRLSSEDFGPAEIMIIERWTESEGNVMYKALCDFAVWKQYELWKLSKDSTVWESVFSTT
jgi:beta-lactamase regulating signal transducer with metallopeptidase domain